jgi:pyruvate/2-oxoglutarate/acetoin dehydrogenase E1 component
MVDVTSDFIEILGDDRKKDNFVELRSCNPCEKDTIIDIIRNTRVAIIFFEE